MSVLSTILRLRSTAPAQSRLPGPATEMLVSEDRCDVRRQGHWRVSCSLPVGHGSNHSCSTREGEYHEWA